MPVDFLEHVLVQRLHLLWAFLAQQFESLLNLFWCDVCALDRPLCGLRDIFDVLFDFFGIAASNGYCLSCTIWAGRGRRGHGEFESEVQLTGFCIKKSLSNLHTIYKVRSADTPRSLAIESWGLRGSDCLNLGIPREKTKLKELRVMARPVVGNWEIHLETSAEREPVAHLGLVPRGNGRVEH